MNTELQSLLALLSQTFEKGAWHGPTIRESLRGISSHDALNRLPNTHSVIELVAHMTVWRNYVTRQLKGDRSYKVTDDLNFPKHKTWDEALTELDNSQHELLAAIEAHAPADLSARVPWTTENLLTTRFFMVLSTTICTTLVRST